MTADDIISKNESVLIEFFTGMASGDYYDGRAYQLYLDKDDGSLRINIEVSTNSWLQRDDDSLALIHQVCGYTDAPDADRYTDGCDLADYGIGEWQAEIEDRITDALRA